MIKFYSSSKAYGFLSNFSRHPITVNDKEWPTVEHYFQAMKSTDPAVQELMRLQDGPGAAKRTGHQITRRSDWEEVKMGVMKDALIAKFTQHPDLRQQLLDTGYEELVEDSPIDWEWGCGKDGTGKNKLGKLLMEVRDELR